MKLYVASSWKNEHYPLVIDALAKCPGVQIYDFRNGEYFRWFDIDPEWERWSVRDSLSALKDPLAVKAYKSDREAMEWADGCVLVMPAGRSACLEAGWFSGRRKPLWILVPEKIDPELMFKLADETEGAIVDSLRDLCSLVVEHEQDF